MHLLIAAGLVLAAGGRDFLGTTRREKTPLLMCPNCQANMTTLNRANVEFDMCPTCRGVWLDRGELEKLMEGARASEPAPMPAAQPYSQQQPHQRRLGGYYDERGEQGERGARGERGYGDHGKRKRGMGIFDIFD